LLKESFLAAHRTLASHLQLSPNGAYLNIDAALENSPQTMPVSSAGNRKILHVDMDCFYAAIEVRDHPELRGKPVAVGGSSGRGVLTTCNYEAREFGCRSAMPAFKAKRLCPKLIMMPVRFDAYREVSRQVREIFAQFTDLIEPLSLDEAYLDVSHLDSSAPSVAAEVRARICERTGLTASAGIAENIFLAKVASDWRKPDGQFEVAADEVADFVAELPVEKIWGVGQRTAEKIHKLGVKTCGELQKISLVDLDRYFGKFGRHLYDLCRGEDDRKVNPNRERKSVSNERTFSEDLQTVEEGIMQLKPLVDELRDDVGGKHQQRTIREAVVKLKFSDFTTTTAQKPTGAVEWPAFEELIYEAWQRGDGKSVRLIGTGVRFVPLADEERKGGQLEFF
jgi:DNA polymerase-4